MEGASGKKLRTAPADHLERDLPRLAIDPRRAGRPAARRALPAPGAGGPAGDRLRRRRTPRSPRRSAIRTSASSAPRPSSTASPRRPPWSPSSAFPMCAFMATTWCRCSTGSREGGLDQVDLLYPDPGRSAGTGSGASCAPTTSPASPASWRPAGASASPPTSNPTPPGRCAGSRPICASNGPPSAPTTGGCPGRGWPGTRYEAKARREGRMPGYYEFRRL